MSNSAKAEVKFFPPQTNALLTRILQSICYLVIYLLYEVRLVIDDRDVAKLKAIAERRVVYLPNHSNLDDGLVMFALSARVGQLFNYVVAYEAFRGLIGKLMQVVGAYSIRRGVGDRYSIVKTLEILQQPQCKLVIFPEGGCSYQNDTTIPFRSGAIELSFKAMEKIVKQQGSVPDFYLVPISIKYRYPKVTPTQLAEALSRLETALSLKPAKNDFYWRLRNIAGCILANLEAEYNLTPLDVTDWNQRIEDLRQRMIDYCEDKLDLTPVPDLPNRERIYKVQYILSSLSEVEQSNLNYEHLYQTTVRLLNFDAIYDGYVATNPTIERFFDTIDRLEREIFVIDRPKSKGQREAIVKIGTPIDLKEYWQAYQSDRQQAIDNLTQTAQQIVQANLNLQ
ncbi:1-acyl-sn-glycerol-3-phosphate acyltransferase [Pleurocapsales cyanobacterium LEGE 10410]|nr:1-acyl-sn-glycerol-3-phosphate acyltransferase [Pleurocapsales cyanobacterium LEGE 10410]